MLVMIVSQAQLGHKLAKSGKGKAQQHQGGFMGMKSKDTEAQGLFQFKRLNDEALFKKDISFLSDIIADPDLPAELSKRIEKARNEENEKLEKAKTERRQKLESYVKQSLDDGVQVKRIMQKLTPRVFVVDYNDLNRRPNERKNVQKSPLNNLKAVTSFLCANASPYDEVVIRLESPGGSVMEYGLAASHLVRLKQAGIRTTVCVDMVAASGGYMMACVADQIVSAPFAVLGSIGVVAEMPNVSGLLTKNDVQWLQFTAGKYKRTVGVFTPPTEEAVAKFQSDLENVHRAFKDHVSTNRKGLNVEAVATG